MILRVTEPGRPAFQLRKGEEGISVFVLEAADPPLTEVEILAAFRPGSQSILLDQSEVESKGLAVVSVPGANSLPERLREAHAELRPGAQMTRAQFKQALQELA
jgi:hypothetical protein